MKICHSINEVLAHVQSKWTLFKEVSPYWRHHQQRVREYLASFLNSNEGAGVVNLFGKTLRERAYAMISIAHPDHRNQLKRDWVLFQNKQR